MKSSERLADIVSSTVQLAFPHEDPESAHRVTQTLQSGCRIRQPCGNGKTSKDKSRKEKFKPWNDKKSTKKVLYDVKRYVCSRKNGGVALRPTYFMHIYTRGVGMLGRELDSQCIMCVSCKPLSKERRNIALQNSYRMCQTSALIEYFSREDG